MVLFRSAFATKVFIQYKFPPSAQEIALKEGSKDMCLSSMNHKFLPRIFLKFSFSEVGRELFTSLIICGNMCFLLIYILGLPAEV